MGVREFVGVLEAVKRLLCTSMTHDYDGLMAYMAATVDVGRPTFDKALACLCRSSL